MSEDFRAHRYAIAEDVLWRPRGMSDWTAGTSVNASRSGVLFATDRPVTIGTDVELLFTIRWSADAPMDVSYIMFSGKVVRQADETPLPSFAATIDHYEFIRAGRMAAAVEC